jgi:U32 family peptidase
MQSKKKLKPELLMPAGSFEKLKYAFAYGADAVYAGAPQFSLRARENSLKNEQLAEAVRYTHERGKKFYLTVNILAHNRKIKPFLNKIDELVAAGPDALIMADPGMIDLVKERHPDMEVHLSVQANAMNWTTVKFWHKVGISRIILSRELSIDEAKEIKDNVPEMELEVFVHGAICIAHSGRCLMSNFFSYRDANDGCCNNACRWSYKMYTGEEMPNANPLGEQSYQPLKGDYYLEETERAGQFMQIDEDEHGTYLMNAKDLMAIDQLDQLMEAGVDSFKVEGRSKSIYYLSMITKAYRNAIDEVYAGKPLSPQHKENLYKVHNRGYTPGFLVNRSDHELQRYEEGLTNLYTQEFAAVVKKAETNRLLITPRNKLCIGDKVEIITPNKSLYTTIQSMQDIEGNSVEAIHGGTDKEVWIPTDGVTEDFSLVSRVLDQS